MSIFDGNGTATRFGRFSPEGRFFVAVRFSACYNEFTHSTQGGMNDEEYARLEQTAGAEPICAPQGCFQVLALAHCGLRCRRTDPVDKSAFDGRMKIQNLKFSGFEKKHGFHLLPIPDVFNCIMGQDK